MKPSDSSYAAVISTCMDSSAAVASGAWSNLYCVCFQPRANRMSAFTTTMRQRVNVASKATRSAAVVPSRHMVQQRRGPAPAKGVHFSEEFMSVLSKSLEREESRVSAAGTLANRQTAAVAPSAVSGSPKAVAHLARA
jgi:hypothetical protein